jgi:tight adherence protein B
VPTAEHILEYAPPVLTGVAVALLAASGTPLWDRFVRRRYRDLIGRMEELDLDPNKAAALLRLGGLAVLGLLVAGAAFGFLPIALCLAALALGLPRWLMEGAIRRRSSRLRDQMVGACVAMANASRAGLGLPAALESISRETEPPLGKELAKIVSDYQFSKPLREAIGDAKARIKTDSFTLFANTIQVSNEQGGKLTEALERISRSLQENQRIERKIEADTQASRRMVALMCAFPFGFLAFFSVIEPTGTGLLFTTVPGQLILAGTVAAVYGVKRWSESIINIDV